MPDPHESWQCYTRETNALMEQLFQNLAADMRHGIVQRNDLETEIDKRFLGGEFGEELLNGGAGDTEPEYELEDRVNEVCKQLGWVKVSRWDW